MRIVQGVCSPLILGEMVLSECRSSIRDYPLMLVSEIKVETSALRLC
jgi:hypothetical protein